MPPTAAGIAAPQISTDFGKYKPQLVPKEYRMEKEDNGVNFSRSGRMLRTRAGRRIQLSPSRARPRRHVLQAMARPLKRWLVRHRSHPYPTRAEKVALALGAQMSLVQVSNWFANARRRLKNAVPDRKWSRRIRHYNQNAVGNAELLSIASSDSIWDSDSESDIDDDGCGPLGVGESGVRLPDDHSYSAPEATSSASVSPLPPLPPLLAGDGTKGVPAKYKRCILDRYLHDACRPHLNNGSVSSYDSDLSRSPSASSPADAPLTNTFYFPSVLHRKRRLCVETEVESQTHDGQSSPQETDPSPPKKRKMLTPKHRLPQELDAAVALTSLSRMWQVDQSKA